MAGTCKQDSHVVSNKFKDYNQGFLQSTFPLTPLRGVAFSVIKAALKINTKIDDVPVTRNRHVTWETSRTKGTTLYKTAWANNNQM